MSALAFVSTVALAFVVSFEAGRRERLRRLAADGVNLSDLSTILSTTATTVTIEKKETMDTQSEPSDAPKQVLEPAPKDESTSNEVDPSALVTLDSDNRGVDKNSSQQDTTAASSNIIHAKDATINLDEQQRMPPETPNNQPQSTHVIHVTEQVLGYGGHGTIVYAGHLGGESEHDLSHPHTALHHVRRRVAVKRMVRAYAGMQMNRKISLLIESDGHPNVV